MSRNRPVHVRGGGVVQAGLDARQRGTILPSRISTMGILRGVIVNTYTTDDDASLDGIGIECDVLLVRANFILSRVPVRQANHGRNNAWAPWIPRPSTRVISTGDAVSFTTRSDRGTAQQPAPLYSDLDGDLVTVEFIEFDPDRPLITGALSQPQNLRRIIGSAEDTDASLGWKEADLRLGSPRRNELFFSHYGTEFRINGQGDLLVNTAGAFSDPTNEDASPSVGQVRFNLKNSQRFTVAMEGGDVFEVWKDGAQLRIDMGQGATQRIPLGDDQVTAIKNALDAIDAFMNSIANATPAPPNGALTVANTLTAYNVAHPLIAQAKTDLDAALSDLAKVKKT